MFPYYKFLPHILVVPLPVYLLTFCLNVRGFKYFLVLIYGRWLVLTQIGIIGKMEILLLGEQVHTVRFFVDANYYLVNFFSNVIKW